MFSNKKSIDNIENELLDNDNDFTAITSSMLPDKSENKTKQLFASNEGDADSIYEFTFDPDEETQPPSKQVAPRKKAKPKVIFVNNNYETNVLKTLQTLKNTLKKNSIDADDKENVCNVSAEQLSNHNVKSISPEMFGNKMQLKKESPSRRDCLLKDLSFENTPKVTALKHPKASPWRADIEEISSVICNKSNNLNEISKPGSKSKMCFSTLDNNSTVVENTEPKLKQPRLVDFIKQASERSIKLSNDPKDSTRNSKSMEIVSEDQKILDENNSEQENKGCNNLFEELEIIPSVKPCRRSYGKEAPSPSIAVRALGRDSKLLDFSEELSAINTCNKKAGIKQAKKNEHKTQLTRQEEDEVNAWAEAFNSMCEDVDDFPLVVE